MKEDVRRSPVADAVVAVASVAGVTGLIHPLRHITPVVSTGVLYLLAVLADIEL